MVNESRIGRLMKGYGRLTIFMIPLGIAINFVGGQIAILLKLPLYLDSIGTILVGATCGGLPGALVGLLSNALNSITSPTNFPYAILSILFGLLAGFLAKRGVFKSLWKSFLSALAFAFIGGVGGGIITVILYGGLDAGGTGVITTALVGMGIPVGTAAFISAIPVDLIDKVPTVLIVYLILGRISDRLFAKLPLGSVYLKKRAMDRSDETPEPAEA